MITDKNIKVEMDGKTYLQYLKYKDQRRDKTNKAVSKHFSKFYKHYFTAATLVFIVIVLVETLTYTEPIQTTLQDYIEYGFIFLIFALGISWIIHGVGFLLVRR